MPKIPNLITILPLGLFLGIFFYWPLSQILSVALHADLEVWKQVFTNPLFSRFFRFTVTQSIISVLGAMIIGLPTGYLLSRYRLYGEKFIRAALTVPFLFPPLVLLLGFVLLFDQTGWVSIIFGEEYTPFSFSGIVAAHILYNISLMSRITEGGFASESQGLHDIADTLGTTRWRKMRDISLPRVKSSLISGMLLTFLFSFNSFAIVLILGEVKLQTIEVMIYAQSRLRFNLENAAILAIIQLVINLFVILLYTKNSQEKEAYTLKGIQKSEKKSISSTIFIVLVAFVTWIPAIMVISFVIKSTDDPSVLTQELFSTEFNRFLGTSSSRVILNTLIIGISVSLLSVLFSLSTVLFAYLNTGKSIEKIMVPFILLPMGTSAVTTSFALLQTHGKLSSFSELALLYIIAAQLIIALPFATRAIYAQWELISPDILLVAETMGTGKLTNFREIIFPYLKSGVYVAFLFSLAISIGEFGATFYLVRGEWTTLSLAIDKLFISRSTLLPNLYASFLILFALVLFWIIERIGSLELKL